MISSRLHSLHPHDCYGHHHHRRRRPLLPLHHHYLLNQILQDLKCLWINAKKGKLVSIRTYVHTF